MIKIDSDIPVPSEAANKGRTSVYPFGNMKVGDSFFTETEKERLRPAATQYARRNGVKFTTRKEGAGIRVWRIT